MNVLVTGGYGFIGSFVAERFHKEGHQVYIIDNLTSGRKENVNVPHKFYELSVEDERCEEIFQSIKPDIVIHLAAQVDVSVSMREPRQDAQTNILGLVNMLECANKYGVSKFLFASSAAVYGPNEQVPLNERMKTEPVSPYGINKLLGEVYCGKWNDIYKLPTLAFRFANVYGPRQGTIGEGGVVSIYMQRMMEGRSLDIFGDGEQTRDFIYVEDIVDGIYRGAISDATGIYNLSTNTETSLNELIGILEQLEPIQDVNYKESRAGDIYRSSLDNTMVKKDLDWLPLYSVQEGMEKTYAWFREHHSRKPAINARIGGKSGYTNWFPMIRPYAENLLAFAILFMISQYGSKWSISADIDFKLVYIILLGIVYGARQSILSSVLASGLFFYEALSNGRDWQTLLYDPEALFIFAIYLFFGMVVGFVSDKHKRESVSIHNELAAEKERYVFLSHIYKDTRKIKEELQRQLIGSKDSIGRIYTITRKLESFESEEVITASIDVLENLLDTRHISIYSVNETNHMRLLVQSKNAGFSLPKTIRLDEHPYFREAIESKTMFVNKTMAAEVPMYIVPVIHNQQVIALVSLHEPSFENLNMNYENMLKVSVDMISSSLARAFQYEGATRQHRYIDDLPVLNESAFRQILRAREEAYRMHGSDYTLLALAEQGRSLSDLAHLVNGVKRDSDHLGMIAGHPVLLLSNANHAEAQLVINRLDYHGVEASVLQEEIAYA
ncbi:NAD-dependent epimerase/dehydratase family protein [Paenibacillus wulumuqiensis]|uniref:NAD-dependent epimerase/dehydratase family protein n=1 Tax=Paenibacillus wulumuqiensis TaxID=1567107 RepID=UPI000619ED97|nr:NAD-dependent epimerase/dehydratase family protein [Paenibacillus wulumuqiensis]